MFVRSSANLIRSQPFRRCFCTVKQPSSGPSWGVRLFGLTLVGFGGFWAYKEILLQVDSKPKNTTGGAATIKDTSQGDIKIGGPFNLIDQDGQPRSSADFAGKFMLIYFGFTYCPDICPTELTKIANVMDSLEKVKKDDAVVPILITVDPYRDTPEQIRNYVKEFHPKMVGLTGTPDVIKKVAKDFRIYNVVPESSDSLDYLVDHSVFTFLMDPKGNYSDFFGPDKSEEYMTEKILSRIEEHKKKSNPSVVQRLFNLFSKN